MLYDIKDLVDDHIHPNLDRRALLAALEPEDLGHAHKVACPECEKRTALISKEGRYIRCTEAGGCGHLEDIWSFVQRRGGRSDEETLFHLAGLADYVITHPGPYDFSRLLAAEKKGRLLEDFLSWAEGALSSDKKAMAYLTGRGFTEAAIREVKLGVYAGRAQARDHLLAKGYSREQIEEAGLLTPGLGDTHKLAAGYRDRVGRLTGIACRYLGDPPDGTSKYIYSFGTDKTSPYNLHKARDFLELIIVEGIFDVLSLRVRGIETVIGVEDARLTREQVALLATCGIRKVILAFDRDDAGRNATRDALNILLAQQGIRSYVLELPEGYTHPDEFIEDEGVEACWERIKGAERGVIWRVNHLLSGYDLSTDQGREGALREGMALEEMIADPADGQAFREALATALDMPLEHMLVTLRTERDVAARRDLEAGYRDLLDAANRLLVEGRITELREHITGGMYALRSREMVRRVRYFDKNDFLARAREMPLQVTDLGIPQLTRLAAARPGDLVVIGARGRHGKSTFAYNLFLNQLERSGPDPSLFFALEIPEHIAMARLATIWAAKHRGVRYGYREDVLPHYRNGDFPKEVFEAFNSLGQYGLEKRFSFVARPGSTVDQMISYAQRTADERGGISAIYVDYLGLLRTATLRDEAYRVAEVSSKLRQMAQELACPVFVFTLLSQADDTPQSISAGDEEAVRRELIRRRPELEHFSQSRRLQMEAATMLALYNTEREMDSFIRRPAEATDTSPMEIFVVANREGSAGSHTLEFDMKSGWISAERQAQAHGGNS